MKRYLLLLIFLVASVGASVSNAQETISNDEYWKPIRAAYAKQRTLASRKTQVIVSTYDGKESREEWTYINHPPDGYHYILKSTADGKTTRTEQITIATVKYCKRDGEEWKIVTSYCIPGVGIGGPSNIIKELYEKDSGKLNKQKVTILRNYTTYLNTYSKTADKDGPSYMEFRYWLNSDGLIVQFESKKGLVTSSKPTSTTIEKYEYDPKIKIEAPIK